ncbi:podocalyxin-like protein 2 [Austrofundulus limnaeus]|uniref:Podocalyxin-like protein 2 n=1 Tax=Austrofundulus limnaeus TaxID=52670 RepID=A0A2I4BSQ5_AUSLI|nr:PREDICTED: podocalyxin-like protein 2 [Austrofundulus limnaeus]
MRDLVLFILTALLVSCEPLGSSQRVVPLWAPLFGNGGPVTSRFIQELVRTRRHSASELVRAQPHLVHDMGWPEIQELSRSQTKVDSGVPSQVKSSASQEVARTFGPDVEDVMERMVHLAVPEGPEGYRGHQVSSDRPGAGDTSQEASGFYGMDTEDRDRGEEGAEDREETEERTEEDKMRGETDGHDVPDVLEVNHTTPDLDALIGYTSSLHTSKELSSSFPGENHDYGQQEHRGAPVLEVDPSGRELWETAKDGDVQSSSGYGLLHSSVSASPSPVAGAAVTDVSSDSVATTTPETDTGTDFGLPETFTKAETEREESGGITQNPTAPEVGSAPSREPLQPSVEEERGDLDQKEFLPEEKTRIRQIIPLTTNQSPTTGFTETELESNLEGPRQVVCLNWSELAGRGYVVLNMTKNMNCEEFRVYQGIQLLKIIERVFARRMNSPEGSWVIYLSKPTHQQHQLLMNVASGHGVIETKDVLDMLGEIRKSLDTVGIQSYSAATSCQSRPSKTRSDYGKLFVVLVIIGAVCMIIITSGFIYICWQKRLPALKSMFPAEELRSVENGYHDNPTLDVTNDAQPEMQEKKPSTNGLAAGGGGGGGGEEEDSSHWQAFVNQAVTEDDEEEQDTHL